MTLVFFILLLVFGGAAADFHIITEKELGGYTTMSEFRVHTMTECLLRCGDDLNCTSVALKNAGEMVCVLLKKKKERKTIKMKIEGGEIKEKLLMFKKVRTFKSLLEYRKTRQISPGIFQRTEFAEIIVFRIKVSQKMIDINHNTMHRNLFSILMLINLFIPFYKCPLIFCWAFLRGGVI